MEEKETKNSPGEIASEDTAEFSPEDAAQESADVSEKMNAADLEEEEQAAESAEDAESLESADSETAESEEASKEKRSFFKKKEKEKKKDERDEKIAELNDRIVRNMAEFDNFRKRTEKEKSQMFDIGAKSIVEKILPVIDNFERGMGMLSEEEKQGAFAVGMEKVYKQLMTTLEAAGVTPIEAVGKEFDPNFHNAVMHIEDEELGENVVAEELQKGYLYRDSVVRYSMVKVAN